MVRSLRTLLAITSALVAVVALSPAVALAKKQPSCERPGSTTEAKSKSARLFSARKEILGDTEGRRLYGCLRSVGRPLALADSFDDNYVLSGSWGNVRLAGRFAAWSQADTDISCKAQCPPDFQPTRYSVGVADLKRRKIRLTPGIVAGRGLVLTKTGAVAWTEAGGGSTAVRARDRDGLRTLDTGAIEPASLKLEGSTVSWVKDGVRSSATLR